MVSLRLDSGKLCGTPSLRTFHRSQLLAHEHAHFPALAFRQAHARDLKFRREIFQKIIRCRMESQGGREAGVSSSRASLIPKKTRPSSQREEEAAKAQPFFAGLRRGMQAYLHPWRQ